METYDTARVSEFSDEEFQKVNLYETDELFVDIYCFRPGQEQAPHSHAESEKIYFVLEGTGTFLVGEEERTLDPGTIVHAPKGSPHGVRNESNQVLRVLVMMAPLPTSGGGRHHHHVERRARNLAVLTITSSRDEEDDESGQTIMALARREDHRINRYGVVEDDIDAIQSSLLEALDAVEAVILTGGTGITPDDVTIEAVRPLFDKELPGFGEHLRRLSVDEIGSAVIMTRSTAGVIDQTPVFALPGSESAVDLAMSRIILPELDHVIDLARR